MKLVFVNRFFYPDVSATSQMLSDAAFYLAEKQHNIHVVTSRLEYEGSSGLPTTEVVKGVTVHRIWTTSFGRANLLGRALDYFTFYVSAFFKLVRLLGEGDTVVAKTDPPLISVPVGWAASYRKARLVNWHQDLFPEVATAVGLKVPHLASRFLRWLRDGSIEQAAVNIVIGEQMRTNVLKSGGASGSTLVVPNWADGDSIVPLKEPNPLRTQWQLDGQFIVGYSGNLGRGHEFETLLGAIKILLDDESIKFLFIGGGALMGQLKEKVSAHPNCIFKPYQPRDQLPLTLTLPDVHLTILKPELEGLILPSKVYGVLAAGRPSIFIGDLDGELANMLTSNRVGMAVETGDSQALADAIRLLQNQSDQSEKMGIQARQLYDQSFGRQRSLEKLESVLC
jgi:colanic acid biosynthesis glycosyl transferase WcaI